MEKYTRKQRNEVYKNALNVCASFKDANEYAGLCYLLLNMIGSEDAYPEEAERRFEEFALFRPPLDDDCYWWDAADQASRINCLLFCIAMTESK